MSNSKIDSSRCPGSHPNDCQVLSVSEYTNTSLPDGAQALEHGNAQSEYNYQASSGFHFGLDSPQLAAEQIYAEGSDPKVPLFYSNSFLESLPNNFGIESDPFQLNRSNSDLHAEPAQPTDDRSWTSHEYTTCKDDGKCFTPCESMELESLSSFGWHSQIQEKSKASVEGSSSLSESACDATSKFHEQEVNHLELMDSVDPLQKRLDLRNNNSKENHFQKSLSNEKDGYVLPLDSDGDSKFEGKLVYSSSIGQHLFNGLLTEEGSKKMSSSGANRGTGENENENDVSSIPSEGKLNIQDINAAENYSDSAGANLLLRFDNIPWSASSATNSVTSSLEDASQLSSKISSLLKGDNKELDQMSKTGSGTEFPSEKLTDQLLQKRLKEKLRVWIVQKVAEGSNGPRILDEGGQCVLHLAAALGYDWALKPTIDAGVSVDFRDVNGWTALHWAAFFGREKTVATLISLGADPGASTTRSPEYPSGITPADLASASGHKRISVYLGKRPLNSLTAAFSEFRLRKAEYMRKKGEFLRKKLGFWRRKAEFTPAEAECTESEAEFLLKEAEFLLKEAEFLRGEAELIPGKAHVTRLHANTMRIEAEFMRREAEFLRSDAALMRREAEFQTFLKAQNLGKKMKEDEEEDEGPDDEGPEGGGPEKDERPGKEKEEGKKRAPDSALEGGKAHKILKAHLACMALLTAYYVVQSMETIQMLALVWVEASKKTGETKLSYNIESKGANKDSNFAFFSI
ncbi:hypothetical protein SLEP1_g24090 [Rubroshorea leprosula]|uniref:Uncharacterized protein n=1 Tax=Rubroshorea leprosula TaxID=152421 RepID=A0AAV5JEH1_9ROSI|nr:hypothetical protein SLEP1_g24090 [Rubroshorea leprosula]